MSKGCSNRKAAVAEVAKLPPEPVKKEEDKCPLVKTVTAQIKSVTFRSDHLDKGGKKLLKPSTKDIIKVLDSENQNWEEFESPYGDSKKEFKKPEWSFERGGDADCHPISHTKGTQIKVDVEMLVTVEPKGESATITEVRGQWGDDLNLEKKVNVTTKTKTVTFSGLISDALLPNCVCLYENQSIAWSIVADGNKVEAGSTGGHTVYVTFDTPGGKMESKTPNKFEEKGPTQIVTEARLRYSVINAQHTGEHDEKECVDSIFKNLEAGYFLGRRWIPGQNPDVGVRPNPSLHHYLWLCNDVTALGECHNIAAAFALACTILGVKGPFEVGYMNPWPSRNDDHPTYTKRGDGFYGKYSKPYRRNHNYQNHGNERLLFLDGRGGANNFEGVAKYRNALYAIGDQRFDLFNDADENASTYFKIRSTPGNRDGVVMVIDEGCFDLVFFGNSRCLDPYPGKVTPNSRNQDPKWAGSFRWED
jgi:hypothetical protein